MLTKKRKLDQPTNMTPRKKGHRVDSSDEISITAAAGERVKEKGSPRTPRKEEQGEKRLRRFRDRAPQSYSERLERALSQRYEMFALTVTLESHLNRLPLECL